MFAAVGSVVAYHFEKKDHSVATAIRRISVEQIDLATQALKTAELPLSQRIHEARKAVKKLRGLLRMIRPAFKDYTLEDNALRDAGRSIVNVRDAQVGIVTLQAVSVLAHLSPQDIAPLRAVFEARVAAVEAPEAFAAQIDAFLIPWQDLRRRACDWTLQCKGYGALEDGLQRSFIAACRAERAVGPGAKDVAVHEWRKRAKDHWYQARLLEPIWPAIMQVHSAEAGRLGDILGEHQDIAVLIGQLPETALADRVRLAANARQKELLATAHPLSRRIFAGSPSSFAHRWGAWWKVWKAG